MRILLAEDEERIARSIKQGLEFEGYSVEGVFDGESAEFLASTESYDLCIFDIMMPGKDGVSVAKALRARDIKTPLLFLTAKAQVDDRVIGLDAGADDYLVKPFAFEELLARIRALIRRPPLQNEEVLTFADVELSLSTFRAQRSGKDLGLSSKEFALLAHFLRHPNIVLSKQNIIEKVWNYESDILPNTVEVFIRHLRKKLDEPFPHSPSLIHTVRGFGYRLGS